MSNSSPATTLTHRAASVWTVLTGRAGQAWAFKVTARAGALTTAVTTVHTVGEQVSDAVLGWCTGPGAPALQAAADATSIEAVGAVVAAAIFTGSAVGALASGAVWVACRAVRR